MQNMPDKIVKGAIKQIEETQISIKNKKIEFENERKQDKERGIERSIVMLGFENYLLYRTSKKLNEAKALLQKALVKKGKERIEVAMEGIEILDGLGFGLNEVLSEHMINHLAMMEYSAFRAGFFQAAGKFDTWLKGISEEKLIEAQKKAKETKFEDIRL